MFFNFFGKLISTKNVPISTTSTRISGGTIFFYYQLNSAEQW